MLGGLDKTRSWNSCDVAAGALDALTNAPAQMTSTANVLGTVISAPPCRMTAPILTRADEVTPARAAIYTPTALRASRPRADRLARASEGLTTTSSV